jgi:outer membrane protein assembly factor BamB
LATSGFDLETGKLIWSVDGPSEQMVASILEEGDLLFAMGGYPERHLLAIKKGGVGDVTQSHIVWRTHRGVPYVPSALMYGGLLHVVSDEGMYTCYDPPTGRQHQQKRVSTHISGSLVGGDGVIYITDDDGRTTVLANSAGFEVVGRNSIDERVFSTPAISQGCLFIRGEKHLVCVGSP